MAAQILSSIIGSLQQDGQFEDWWKSGEVPIPFLDNQPLPITFMDCLPEADTTFIEEADQALTHFLRLTSADRLTLSTLVYAYCQKILDLVDNDDVDESLRELKDPHEVWRFIYPSEIYVTRRAHQEEDIYVTIAAECEWEQEHGLQLVFRQGKKLTRISEQDGHVTEADAWGKPDAEDELLSQF